MKTLDAAIEALRKENSRSNDKHGDWSDMDELDQEVAINREIGEWLRARKRQDIHGDHGEIREALHVANVMLKRIMFLSRSAA